jgi:ribonuclease HIII
MRSEKEMNQSKLQANIDALREFVQSNGWTILDEKEIQYGYQLRITDGKTSIPVDFFTTGRALIQGKPGELETRLTSWWNERKAASVQPETPAVSQSTFVETPSNAIPKSFTGKARIGMDESGKGDYFGPLVIAAVYVDQQTEDKLTSMGVQDSKLLTDRRMQAMSREIKALCPNFVVPIEPKRYNELYNKVQNLNRLLGWGHAWALEKMLERVSCNLAIVDQFGDESLLQNALMKKGRQIKLEQRPRAEEDIAVAAASILARAKFVQQLEQLSGRIGKTLPKGASDPAIVTIGREIVARHGREILAEIAKLHFKTTEMILQS